MTVYTSATAMLAAVTAKMIAADDIDPDDYDLPSIVDDCFNYSDAAQGFVQTASDAEFWLSVDRHAYA
ncbi:hypothetical protein [Rhodococcus sp. C-2]|uniref:hypothetical protein n=1 Tax=Rhodococcus sp. C-2 TaxID=3018809 RepID=UPI0022EAFB0E|nr:hypothetical protein [Rhodococcus sp. C-2]MDA3633983.1 hypothetical protein [Rhodococcus sp. C-2]